VKITRNSGESKTVDKNTITETTANTKVGFMTHLNQTDTVLVLNTEAADFMTAAHLHHNHYWRKNDVKSCRPDSDLRSACVYLFCYDAKDLSFQKLKVRGISLNELPEDPNIQKEANKWDVELHENFAGMNYSVNKEIANCPYDLDTRSKIVRFKSNFFTSLVTSAFERTVKGTIGTGAIILWNSGSIRLDEITKKGILTVKHILSMVPYRDKLLVIKVCLQNVIDLLKKNPTIVGDGNFLHYSGLAENWEIYSRATCSDLITTTTVKHDFCDVVEVITTGYTASLFPEKEIATDKLGNQFDAISAELMYRYPL